MSRLPDLPGPPDLPGLQSISRRDFLTGALLLPAILPQTPNAHLVRVVPLGNPGGAPATPFGRLLGSGLDARLFTDLSALAGPPRVSQDATTSLESPRTTVRDFFVRTAFPSTLHQTDPWRIHIGGRVETPIDLPIRDLDPQVTSAGRVLIECSGNADQSNYGLMSAADWEGAPLESALARVKPATPSYRVLVSGFDDDVSPSRTSVPGASWIFTRDDISRAILAVRMNGEPLTRDHGSPVRLLVPGWYGCASIKWVDRIELVADDAPATIQMREFAARTHQGPGAVLARDFVPAVIDTAAMPVRVEKWLIDGRLSYRVVGIIWGGSRTTNKLSIRFRTSQPWVPVDDCPMPASTLTWSLWSHTWKPEAPGRYQIVLRVDDTAIRTRRLDVFFYVREIDIDEV